MSSSQKLKKRVRKVKRAPVLPSVRVASLDSLVQHPYMKGNLGDFIEKKGAPQSLFEEAKMASSKPSSSRKELCFVSPILPHPCEMEIWNEACQKEKDPVPVFSLEQEKMGFRAFERYCARTKKPLKLCFMGLGSVSENTTFLSGLEDHLADYKCVVSVGENSLASYQALKVRKNSNLRVLVWQTSPRPHEVSKWHGLDNTKDRMQVIRERTVRKEVLKNCDALVCFDKEGTSWAYLENVNAQRIRRISRGVNLQHFAQEMNASMRVRLRRELGLPETDFIFLHAGALELETGAIDTLYAYKHLLLSHASYFGGTKLIFCGTGSLSTDIRQLVVQFKLEEQVLFLNMEEENVRSIVGSRLSDLLALCDAFIYNPQVPQAGNCGVNVGIDNTYDVLCALASGLTVLSNGSGWAGDWISKYYKTFSHGNIFSLAKGMCDSIERQDRLKGIKKAVRKAIESEFPVEKSAQDLRQIIESIIHVHFNEVNGDINEKLEVIRGYIRSNRYGEAIDLIEHAFRSEDLSVVQQATLFCFIGDCFTKLGDLRQGEEHYQKSLELDALHSKAWIGLGTVELQLQNYASSVLHFQKAVAYAPQDEMASLGLSFAFEGLGEMKEAMNWAVKAADLSPYNTATLYSVVKYSYALEMYDEAQRLLVDYINVHPYDLHMCFSLAGILYRQERYEPAARLLEAILKQDPKYKQAQEFLQKMAQEQNPERQVVGG